MGIRAEDGRSNRRKRYYELWVGEGRSNRRKRCEELWAGEAEDGRVE